MTVTRADKAKQFRSLHEAPEAFVIADVWDGGWERMMAALGFPGLATSSGASADRPRAAPPLANVDCATVTMPQPGKRPPAISQPRARETEARPRSALPLGLVLGPHLLPRTRIQSVWHQLSENWTRGQYNRSRTAPVGSRLNWDAESGIPEVIVNRPPSINRPSQRQRAVSTQGGAHAADVRHL